MGKVKEVAGKPGWVEGDAADFLGLSEAESLLIELKITTSTAIRRLRAALPGQSSSCTGTAPVLVRVLEERPRARNPQARAPID
jgi:hypothetical protein